MRIKVLLIIMISVCILSACSFTGLNESENETSEETNMMLGLVPNVPCIEGNIIEVIDDTQACVQITWRSQSEYEIGECIYINYTEVYSMCYATIDEDEEWDKVGKCQDIIEADEALTEYFSKISVGDTIYFGYDCEDDVTVIDENVYINVEGRITKKVYDPHLDPVFEGKYDFWGVQ